MLRSRKTQLTAGAFALATSAAWLLLFSRPEVQEVLAIPWLRLLLAIGLTLGFAFLGSEYVARWLYRWLRSLGKRVIDVGPVRNAVLYGGSPVILAMLYGALLVLSNPEASRSVQVAAGLLVVAFSLPVSLLLIYFLDAWTDEYAEDDLRRQLVGAEPYDKELFNQSLERAKAELLDPEIDPIMRVIRQWRMTTLEKEMASGRPKVPEESSKDVVSNVMERDAERRRRGVRAEGEVQLEDERVQRDLEEIRAQAAPHRVTVALANKEIHEAEPVVQAPQPPKEPTVFEEIKAGLKGSRNPELTAQLMLKEHWENALMPLVEKHERKESGGLTLDEAKRVQAKLVGEVTDYLHRLQRHR